MHFAEWSDVAMTLWIFRGPEHCILLVHEHVDMGMSFITKPQAV
jgi:hypothetical protein